MASLFPKLAIPTAARSSLSFCWNVGKVRSSSRFFEKFGHRDGTSVGLFFPGWWRISKSYRESSSTHWDCLKDSLVVVIKYRKFWCSVKTSSGKRLSSKWCLSCIEHFTIAKSSLSWVLYSLSAPLSFLYQSSTGCQCTCECSSSLYYWLMSQAIKYSEVLVSKREAT